LRKKRGRLAAPYAPGAEQAHEQRNQDSDQHGQKSHGQFRPELHVQQSLNNSPGGQRAQGQAHLSINASDLARFVAAKPESPKLNVHLSALAIS
jgi:hypothetical protein